MSQSALEVLVLLLLIAENSMIASADCCLYQRAGTNLPGKFHHLGRAERKTAASAFSQQLVGGSFHQDRCTPLNTDSYLYVHVKLRVLFG